MSIPALNAGTDMGIKTATPAQKRQPVWLEKSLHRRIKRLQSVLTLRGCNPPSVFGFLNEAVASRLAREEKRHGIATPAA